MMLAFMMQAVRTTVHRANALYLDASQGNRPRLYFRELKKDNFVKDLAAA
jgi:hypothetical protein